MKISVMKSKIAYGLIQINSVKLTLKIGMKLYIYII